MTMQPKNVAAASQLRPALQLLFPVVLFLLLFAVLLLVQPGATFAQEGGPLPQSIPDAEVGLQLFEERCANCHGPLGRGDGEMAAQLPRPPASLSSEEYINQVVPAEMFDVITNGVMGAETGGAMPIMPPFGAENSNPIAEANRWDLVAAVYSLGTAPEALEEGAAVYEASCASCHGEEGLSDEFDLTQQEYWINRSNQQVVAVLQDGAQAPAHDGAYDLSETELASVVDYARTFSYDYSNPMAAFEPIEAATVTGTVTNETTGEPVAAGTAVVLNAFTSSFEPSLTLTSTVNEAGSFSFDLTQVPPDLVYVATVEYDGISYGSSFAELQRDDPQLNLTVPVYDQSSDPSGVRISQIHMILEFAGEEVVINELYQFSNDAPTVFVGDRGNLEEGTVELALPDGASTPSFQRTFGSMDSFFPAENVIPTDGGWADTVAVRPGENTLSLLARYSLPYESGMEISHPVYYDVGNVNLVLADVGVSVAEEDAWVAQDAQAMAGGMFLNYARPGLQAGEDVDLTLEGEPQEVATGTGGNAVAPRNQTNELLIGAGILLLAVAAGAYFVRLWQQSRDTEPARPVSVEVPGEEPVREPSPLGAVDQAERREALLLAIAELDEAYEAGEIGEEAYAARREKLKMELMAIWEG